MSLNQDNTIYCHEKNGEIAIAKCKAAQDHDTQACYCSAGFDTVSEWEERKVVGAGKDAAAVDSSPPAERPYKGRICPECKEKAIPRSWTKPDAVCMNCARKKGGNVKTPTVKPSTPKVPKVPLAPVEDTPRPKITVKHPGERPPAPVDAEVDAGYSERVEIKRGVVGPERHYPGGGVDAIMRQVEALAAAGLKCEVDYQLFIIKEVG